VKVALLIGLDVGTTAAKAALFDERGRQIALGEHAYGVDYPRQGWAEQDAEELWSGAVSAIQQVVAHIPNRSEVAALGVSAQGATTILVDRQHRPMRPAISWLDQRAAGRVAEIAEELDAQAVYCRAGWPLSPWLPLCTLAWLRQNEPEIFDADPRLCFVDDFIKFRLCGEFVMDPSSASITGLFDVKQSQWHAASIAYIGFDRAHVSSVAPHGTRIAHLTPPAAKVLGLPRSTWVVNGAHDQICCVTAAGVVQPGRILLGTGTAWVIAGVSSRPIYDLARRMCLEPHSMPGLWSPLRSQGGVGASVEWLMNSVLAGPGPSRGREELYACLNQQVIASPPGAHGLIFLPPRGRSNNGADGSLIGLSLSHTPGDVMRALLEGITCDLRLHIQEMRASGVEVDTLIMTGGATRSPIWPSIVADLVKVPVRIPQIAQAGARGAAILATVGAEIYPDVRSAVDAFRVPGREIFPDQGRSEEYDALFTRYQRFDGIIEEET